MEREHASEVRHLKSEVSDLKREVEKAAQVTAEQQAVIDEWEEKEKRLNIANTATTINNNKTLANAVIASTTNNNNNGLTNATTTTTFTINNNNNDNILANAVDTNNNDNILANAVDTNNNDNDTMLAQAAGANVSYDENENEFVDCMTTTGDERTGEQSDTDSDCETVIMDNGGDGSKACADCE